MWSLTSSRVRRISGSKNFLCHPSKSFQQYLPIPVIMLLNRGIQPALMGKVIATFPHAHALPLHSPGSSP